MAIRLKVFLIITVIVLVISASSVIISISSAQNQIIKTLEDDTNRLVAGANEYILNQISLLKMDAAAIGQALKAVPIEEAQLVVLPEQVYAYDFAAIALYNAPGGIRASSSRMGFSPPPESVVLGEAGQLAFNGERIITSTYQDPSGRLVFYVFAPMDDFNLTGTGSETSANPQIIGLTLPANFFNEELIRFQSGNFGHLLMVDSQGKIIADAANDWAVGEVNFIELAKEDQRFNDMARVIRRVISGNADGDRNVDRYALRNTEAPWENLDAVMAFKPIPTTESWAIVASSSIMESSFKRVRLMIALSGLIFLGLGVVAAGLASGIIAKPFEVAEELAKGKTTFIANLSNDLRTPLNAVIGFSDLSLSKKDLPSDVQGYIEKTEESGMAIMRVINDLLDISNIESGKFGVISARYDLPSFILETANSNLPRVGEKPVVFNIVADEKLPAQLNGDVLRLRQIFNNLLGYAYRHTKEGTIEWKISTERAGDSVWLVSSVSDTSEGITSEVANKLFLDYSSLGQKRRSFRATGMGLPLAKKIVDLMNGTIAVESTYGKGAKFTVRLPQKYVSDEVISAELARKLKEFKSIAGKPASIANMHRVHLPDAKVLVVDEAEINLDVAREMIKPYGIQVDCVLSTHEAVELIRKGQPCYSAIFMNRWMPDMNGMDAIRIIRNEIGTKYAETVPVIAITSNAIIGNNAFFMEAGFQDVISKPLDILRLDAVIRKWIAGEKLE
ncbi:MAG: response regulator [Treponema sp.]|nr:response regulator [Treponema sp.]